ncbi:MAG: DUF1963 domain-containing protein [Pseudomonadota bacterium]
MINRSDNVAGLGLLLRPIPSNMVVAEEAVIIGGLPRLPDDLEWPHHDDGTAIHFLAQINLSRLPREHDGLRTPDFPQTGTLFVFLPLDRIDHAIVQVLHTARSVSVVPERDPPKDLPKIATDRRNVDPQGIIHDGKVLISRNVEVLPFASPQEVSLAPLRDEWWDGTKEERDEILRAHEKARRKYWKNVTAAFRAARPLPPPPKETTPDASERPQIVPGDFRRRLPDTEGEVKFDTFEWQFVFDWAKFFYLHCLRLAKNEVFRVLDDVQSREADPTVWLKQIVEIDAAIDHFQKLQQAESAWPLQELPPEPLSVLEPFDDQARRWLEISAQTSGELPPNLRNAFVAMLDLVQRRGSRKQRDVNDYEISQMFPEAEFEDDAENARLFPAGIRELDDRVADHHIHAGTTLLAAQDSFEIAGRLAQARQTQPLATKSTERSQEELWDRRLLEINAKSFGASDRTAAMLTHMPMQIFGMQSVQGVCWQGGEDRFLTKVMLLQIGSAAGLPFDFGNLVRHLWITPEDLAAGRFDRVETTTSTP